MKWLLDFLDKKFGLTRVPPLLWLLLVPFFVVYFPGSWIWSLMKKIYLFIMWLIGFKHCDMCHQWHWAHVKMERKFQYKRIDPNNVYVGFVKDAEGNNKKFYYNECLGCIVADKLTED